MSYVSRKIRRLMLLLSKIATPPARRSIRHLRLEKFEMLVQANETVGRHLGLFGVFEATESAFFRSVIRDADICFDVGGNVGYFSMLLAALAPRGAIHVFEPIPLNAALIAANRELNGYTHIHISNCAVGDQAQTLNFTVSADSAYSSLHDVGRSLAVATIAVQMITLDDYVKQHGIPRVDILKVDVEGAEGLVIQGAAQLLGDVQRAPRVVLMELYQENMVPFGTSVAEALARMASFGYRAHTLSQDGRQLKAYSGASSVEDYNFVFVRQAVTPPCVEQ